MQSAIVQTASFRPRSAGVELAITSAPIQQNCVAGYFELSRRSRARVISPRRASADRRQPQVWWFGLGIKIERIKPGTRSRTAAMKAARQDGESGVVLRG
jgi:hypothetical protein